jgi:cyclopropane-fatty-acyl-phospholipid synthase
MSEMSMTATMPDARSANWMSRMLLSRVARGRLTLVTPGGSRLIADAGGGPEATLVLHRWRTVRRVLLDGDIGFAESYLDGDWTSPDLPALIELAAVNHQPSWDGTWLSRGIERIRHRLNANTRRGSSRNIRHHYDLGNDFYRTWLDAGMSYSSALYDSPDRTLEEAQIAKQDRVLASIDPQPGQRVLEIGCGWGGLAKRLVDAGCDVAGVTLSPAQLADASQRASGADLQLRDYRDVTGEFDRIVSVEMLEAVGEAFWPAYFGTLHDRLREGGLAAIQAITISEAKFGSYRRSPDFIQRYIFPGGMLPTAAIIRQQTERAGLELQSVETFGASYASTLAEWRRRFHAAWPEIERMGFDSRFRRMWDYYLAYCEGGFRAGAIDVGLYVLAKPA